MTVPEAQEGVITKPIKLKQGYFEQAKTLHGKPSFFQLDGTVKGEPHLITPTA